MSAGDDELDLEIAELPPIPPPPPPTKPRRRALEVICYLRPCPWPDGRQLAADPDATWNAHYREAHHDPATPHASHP